MTATNPLGGLPASFDRTVLMKRIDRILAARRLKTTLPAQESAERDTIEQNDVNQ